MGANIELPEARQERLWLRAGKGRPAGVLLTILLALLMALFDLPPEPGLRNSLFDNYQRWFPRERASDPVVIVEVDDVSLSRLGQWPWPRELLATLLDRIGTRQPAAIGIDMIFSEVDRYSPRQQAQSLMAHGVLSPGTVVSKLPDFDEQLARSLSHGQVVLAVTGLRENPGLPPAPDYRALMLEVGGSAAEYVPNYKVAVRSRDLLDRAASGHGLINSVEERDGVVRRVPALGAVNGHVMPGFDLEVLRLAVGEQALRVRVDPHGVREVRLGEMAVPTNADASVWLHFSNPDERLRISAASILGNDPDVDLAPIKGRIVLIGVSSVGLKDQIVTPIGQMAGVEAHAEAIENVFDGDILSRPSWAPVAESALLAVLALIGIVTIPTRRPGVAALALLSGVALAGGLGVAAFLGREWLIDVATPAFGASLVFAFMLVVTLNAAEMQRNTLRMALAATREQQARLEVELDAARRIQTGMLPSPSKVIGDDPRVDLAALMQPARTVGGDLYDFFRVDPSRLFFMVGDVSGKGLPASLFMALSKALIKGAALHTAGDPGRGLTQADAVISQENPETLFVSVAACMIDLDTGELLWCCAGHDSPILVRAGAGVKRLDAEGGPALCMVDGFKYTSTRVRLKPGDTLCLVTDGVTEAGDTRGGLYGPERVADCLQRAAGEATSRKMLERLRKDVEAFAGGLELPDDLTILVMRWKGPPGRANV